MNETLSTVENTTEATITTLGLVHEGMSQSCNVTYGGVVLREEVFNYTLESEGLLVHLLEVLGREPHCSTHIGLLGHAQQASHNQDPLFEMQHVYFQLYIVAPGLF